MIYLPNFSEDTCSDTCDSNFGDPMYVVTLLMVILLFVTIQLVGRESLFAWTLRPSPNLSVFNRAAHNVLAWFVCSSHPGCIYARYDGLNVKAGLIQSRSPMNSATNEQLVYFGVVAPTSLALHIIYQMDRNNGIWGSSRKQQLCETRSGQKWGTDRI